MMMLDLLRLVADDHRTVELPGSQGAGGEKFDCSLSASAMKHIYMHNLLGSKHRW